MPYRIHCLGNLSATERASTSGVLVLLIPSELGFAGECCIVALAGLLLKFVVYFLMQKSLT